MRKEQELLKKKGAVNDRITILTKLIWRNWRLLFYEFDRKMKLLSRPKFMEESEKVISDDMKEKITLRYGEAYGFADTEAKWETGGIAEEPEIFIDTEESGLFYWIFRNFGRIYILGPLCSKTPDFSMEQKFLFLRKMKKNRGLLKQYSLAQSYPIISLVYFCVTGKVWNGEKTYQDFDKITMNHILDDEAVSARVLSGERENVRLAYRFERKWYESIQNGIDISSEGNIMMLDGIGDMSGGDLYKQLEYMNVLQITLAARAAIDGGVPLERAYEISDLFLRKCARCHSVSDLMQIGAQISVTFVQLVKKNSEKKMRDLNVERVKDYVAGHLTEKISVDQMADRLGISHSHLVRIFQKNEGISIKGYILSEKLRAAANQLKYSEAGVGEIAEYLSFSSASSMGAFFKKKYQMTPLEYRKRYKVIEFVSEKKIKKEEKD